jgi:pyruvate,orthophosphate dikinase
MSVVKTKKKPTTKTRNNKVAPKKNRLSRNGKFATKYVYAFGGNKADGRAGMKNLLGGKGANLHEMASLGLPVPAGFTITTEVCTYFYANNRTYPKTLRAEVVKALQNIEKIMNA